MSNVSSIDSTSIIDDLLRIVAHVHDQMETGIKDNTMQWEKITHSRFEWGQFIDALQLLQSSSAQCS